MAERVLRLKRGVERELERYDGLSSSLDDLEVLLELAREEQDDETRLEAGARRFALTLGRCFAAALLARHAQWSLDHENDRRAHAAAARFAQNGLNLIRDPDPALSQLLVDDA